jgi:hypothetical protein
MRDRDRFRNALNNLFTNDLKKKDATDDDLKKKRIDHCALYHDRSYPIKKVKDFRPPLKLALGNM